MASKISKNRSGQVAEDLRNTATTGYEAELWKMADALRGSMDAAEYKHIVMGLLFLKYISDAFEELHAKVFAEFGEEAAEDRDEYIAGNLAFLPKAMRTLRGCNILFIIWPQTEQLVLSLPMDQCHRISQVKEKFEKFLSNRI